MLFVSEPARRAFGVRCRLNLTGDVIPESTASIRAGRIANGWATRLRISAGKPTFLGFLEVGFGFRLVAFLLPTNSPVVVSSGVFRVEPDGLGVVLDRFVEFAFVAPLLFMTVSAVVASD